MAVRSLVEFVFRQGDLDLEFMSRSRSTEGIQAHQRIQRKRPDTYKAEVVVSHDIETDQFILEIGGRIDGVFTDPQAPEGRAVTIEEIKSTRRDLDTVHTAEDPVHWGQAICYAYFYSLEHELDSLVVRLTYCHLDSGKTREQDRSYTRSELEAAFEDILSRYLKWANRTADWCNTRDASIGRLAFPFDDYRPGQRQMAVDAYRTIKGGNQLLVQAATGIGKTMAVIFPSVKAFLEMCHQKVFYLTARTTVQGIAEKAIDELAANGLRIKHLTITAKDKICFNPESACNAEECEYAKGYYDRLNDALECIFTQDAFTRQAIEGLALAHRVCPFEFTLDLSLWVDIIICDYNYAFDPRVYLRRFFADITNSYTFLIDESHNLVDRSREMFSAEITKQTFLDVRRMIKKGLPELHKRMGRVNRWLVQARKECEEAGGIRADESLPESLIPILKRFLTEAEVWLSLNTKSSFREPLLDIYFAVTSFVRVAEGYDGCYVTCYEKLRKDLRLKLFCVDPSLQMKEALRRCRAAIFFSATLTPADYFRNMFGCSRTAGVRVLTSPFPVENLGLFIADRISTYYRERSDTKKKVTEAIYNLVAGNRGNYLVYFPSYVYMKMVHDAFIQMDPNMETMVQTGSMSEDDRVAFLNRFSHDNPNTLVGFAVMGGIFGEGIDLVGDRLSGVAIVGVGLPGISLENNLIREYYTIQQGTGFEYAYMYPGINRVLQAAGRVIRTANDRGVVLLIDKRFATFRYRSLFPDYWTPVVIQHHKQLETDLGSFWNDSGPAAEEQTQPD